MRYERRGWRSIRPGDRIKDPRGDRVIEHADKWGYRLEAGPEYSYAPFTRPWPKVGRLKVLTHIDALSMTVEGRLGPDMVGINITAGPDAYPEILAVMARDAVRALEYRHPAVTDVRPGEWKKITVPLDVEGAAG